MSDKGRVEQGNWNGASGHGQKSHDKFVWFTCKLCHRNFKKKEHLILHRKMEHFQSFFEKKGQKSKREIEIEVQVKKGNSSGNFSLDGEKVFGTKSDIKISKFFQKNYKSSIHLSNRLPPDLVIESSIERCQKLPIKIIEKWPVLTERDAREAVSAIPITINSNSKEIQLVKLPPHLTNLSLTRKTLENGNQKTFERSQSTPNSNSKSSLLHNLTATVGSLSITLVSPSPSFVAPSVQKPLAPTPTPATAPFIESTPIQQQHQKPPLALSTPQVPISKPCATVQPQPQINSGGLKLTPPLTTSLVTRPVQSTEEKKETKLIYNYKCDVCSLRYKDYHCLMEHKKQHSAADWREYLTREKEKEAALLKAQEETNSDTAEILKNQSKLFEKVSHLEKVVNRSVREREEIQNEKLKSDSDSNRIKNLNGKFDRVEVKSKSKSKLKSKSNGRNLMDIFPQSKVKGRRGRSETVEISNGEKIQTRLRNPNPSRPVEVAVSQKSTKEKPKVIEQSEGRKTRKGKGRPRLPNVKADEVKKLNMNQVDPLAIFEKPSVIPDQEWPYFDTSGRIYCICNDLSYGPMIGCDNEDCPKEWFHFPCVGITSDENIGEWFCPPCSASRTTHKESQSKGPGLRTRKVKEKTETVQTQNGRRKRDFKSKLL